MTDDERRDYRIEAVLLLEDVTLDQAKDFLEQVDEVEAKGFVFSFDSLHIRRDE